MVGKAGFSLFSIGLAAVVLSFSYGCSKKDLIWTENFSFHSGKWYSGEKITFAPDSSVFLTDSLPNVVGVLSIRYSSGMQAERFPIVMETECPGAGAYYCDTILFSLIPVAKRSADKATLGVFESADTLRLPVNPSPGWSVTFYPVNSGSVAAVDGLFSVTFDLIKP